jgi:hypothetical protein
MLTAEGRVETDRARRYLAQLGQHAHRLGPRAHRGGHTAPHIESVDWSDTQGTLTFPWGRCVVEATEGALLLRAEAGDEESLRRIQDGVGRRIETVGRRDRLIVTWRQPHPMSTAPGRET